MKKFALLAGIALLAACGAKEEAAAPDTAATEAAAATPAAAGMTTANGTGAGSYDVTAPDGTKMVSTLMEDGTYVDRDTAGKVTEKGTWAVKEGKTCFDAEGDAAEVCYTEGTRAADGSFDVTGPDGKITKVAPHAG